MNPADLFRQDSDTLNLNAGEALFNAGDKGSEMYVLLEGRLEIKVGDLVVEESSAGAMVGEMSLIDDSPRTATVIAKEPCRLARINLRRFHFLVQQNPFFASHVMKIMVGRLRRMNERMAPQM
jgi:CRP-like cAMP-binding protein